MPKVTVEPAESVGDCYTEMSLWVNDDCGDVYFLTKVRRKWQAISVDGDHSWDNEHDTPQGAVDGLVPFHGKVTIEN